LSSIFLNQNSLKFHFGFSPIPNLEFTTNFNLGQFAIFTNRERRFQLFSTYGKDEWYDSEMKARFGRKNEFDTLKCN
jgi:hypothetical protein